jgi:hypothetical protein
MLDIDDVYKSNELYMVKPNKLRKCIIENRNTECIYIHMSMYIKMFACICIHVHINECAFKHIYVYVNTYKNTFTNTSICRYLYTSISAYAHIYAFTDKYVLLNIH